MTTRHRIFLAHAREDKPQVRKLYADLKARGLDPWLDEVDLMPGQIWKVEIPKAIRQAEIFLACLSSRSVEKVGYVQNEFRLALSAFGERPPESIYLIPVRFDECAVPDLQIPDRGLSLQDIQWVDLWQEGGFERLVASIERALTVGTPPPQAVRKEAPSSWPPQPVALQSKVAPDQPPVLIAPNDPSSFLSQPVDKDTLADYTKWKYHNLPLNQKIHELLISDLAHSRFVTLRDVDRAIEAATDAVESHRKENPGLFKAGTDFVTKSLGFVDMDFRARHPFSQRTREAFSKYEHLVQLNNEREAARDQVEPIPRREPKPQAASVPHRKIIVAILRSIGVVAAFSRGRDRRRNAVGTAVAIFGTVAYGAWWIAERGPSLALPLLAVKIGLGTVAAPAMVELPPGAFDMGSDDGGPTERPRHRVTVPAFALGKYEVTFDDWDVCVADGGCNGYKPGDEDWGRGRRPVINVSWLDAKAYIAWLSKVTDAPYRLPSEAEWEYAARAGSETVYWWGDEAPTPDRANFGRNARRTNEVGSYAPNPLEVYDMNGNVWEWVEDCWNHSYKGAPNDGSARTTSGDCSRRMLRGGSWYGRPEYLRSAHRYGGSADFRSDDVGFRVARTLTP